MSTPKVYTSQQFEQSQSIAECPRCHQQQEMYIELGCGHKFCIVCITFSYLKYKNTLTHDNKLKCLQCDKISQLDEQLDQLIKQIINKQLGPIVKNDSENNESRMSINQAYVKNDMRRERSEQLSAADSSSVYTKNASRNMTNNNLVQHKHAHLINNPSKREHKHTFKSQQESLIVDTTPPKHANRFYSKCQTPESSQDQSSINDNCPLHQHDQISYICVTCQFRPLCYKCIKSNKHYNHEVKIVKKAMEIIGERLSLLNLQSIEKIQNLELYQKRLYDRKLIFEERIDKSIKEIKQIFSALEKKITAKMNEIIDAYQQLCSTKIEEIQNKAQQNSQMLEKIKHFQQQVNQFLSISDKPAIHKPTALKPSKLIRQFEQIQQTRLSLFPQNDNQSNGMSIFKVHQQIIDPTTNYHNSELIKWISKISQDIDNITLNSFSYHYQEKQRFNQTVPVASILKEDPLFCKNRTVVLRQCSSRDQFHKINPNQNCAKRIKTNVPISLNTSRDKRDKKITTKTQQDERRLKSKANYKTQANTLAKNSANQTTEKQSTKQIPAYITKCIEKHHTQNSRKVSPFNHTTGYMQQNSKNASKIIAKTGIFNNHEQNNNRKKMKDHGSCEMIKEKKPILKSAKHVEGVTKKKK